jgi:hypothetical protein
VDAEIRPQQKTFLVRRPSTGESWREVDELMVVVGRPGKYRYRCSHTCGSMHPFMLGEMIVTPNLPLYGGISALTGLFLGMLIASSTFTRRAPTRAAQEPEGELATQV